MTLSLLAEMPWLFPMSSSSDPVRRVDGAPQMEGPDRMRLTQTDRVTFDRRSLLKAAAVSAAVAAPESLLRRPRPAQQPKAQRSARMASTGSGNLSPAGIARLHDAMTVHVENGRLPGLVTLVSRRGETHVDAIGTFAFGDATPMPRDTIFRIASVTKPITAAAAMILVEECKLRLDDPVDRLLPELADRQVLKQPRQPARRHGAGEPADHAPRPADVPRWATARSWSSRRSIRSRRRWPRPASRSGPNLLALAPGRR